MEKRELQTKIRQANLDRAKEVNKKRRKIFAIKIAMVFLALLLLVAGLALLSRIKALSIKDIKIEGNRVLVSEDIIKEINKDLSGNYFFFFPKRNALLYPKNEIKKTLSEKFHRIETYSVVRRGLNTLTITLTERAPAYLWCGFSPIRTENSNPDTCFFLDNEGFIFDNAPYFSGSVYFKFYGTSNFEQGINPVGKSIISKDEFENLVKAKDALIELDLSPEAMVILGGSRVGEGEFILSRMESAMDLKPRVIFKMTDDLAKSTENLKAALLNEPLKTDIKARYFSLKYLDLRYTDKVYFKF